MGATVPTRIALAALTVTGATGVGAAVWGVGIERQLYTVRRHELRVLPAGAPPLRVLHISDVHMAPWQHRKQRWIAGLARLAPDVVVNTGDNLGHAEGLDGIRRAFTPLRGIPGVFVHGSNDYSAPALRNPLAYFTGPSRRIRTSPALDAAALDAFLTTDLGWTAVDNAATLLAVRGVRIAAFGVADAHRRWDRAGDLPAAVAALDAGGARAAGTGMAGSGMGATVRWGVTHAPYRRVLDAFCDLGADVIFGGHTHGGQVRVPLSHTALVANCDIPLDQARGLSTWAHRGRRVPLNVSAGLGHSIYAPVRFACRPEASLITLLPR